MLVVGTVVTLQEWLLRTARAVCINMNLHGKIFVTDILLYHFTEVRLHCSQNVLGWVDVACSTHESGRG
jgi:hypothetical protein